MCFSFVFLVFFNQWPFFSISGNLQAHSTKNRKKRFHYLCAETKLFFFLLLLPPEAKHTQNNNNSSTREKCTQKKHDTHTFIEICMT